MFTIYKYRIEHVIIIVHNSIRTFTLSSAIKLNNNLLNRFTQKDQDHFSLDLIVYWLWTIDYLF